MGKTSALQLLAELQGTAGRYEEAAAAFLRVIAAAQETGDQVARSRAHTATPSRRSTAPRRSRRRSGSAKPWQATWPAIGEPRPRRSAPLASSRLWPAISAPRASRRTGVEPCSSKWVRASWASQHPSGRRPDRAAGGRSGGGRGASVQGPGQPGGDRRTLLPVDHRWPARSCPPGSRRLRSRDGIRRTCARAGGPRRPRRASPRAVGRGAAGGRPRFAGRSRAACRRGSPAGVSDCRHRPARGRARRPRDRPARRRPRRRCRAPHQGGPAAVRAKGCCRSGPSRPPERGERRRRLVDLGDHEWTFVITPL